MMADHVWVISLVYTTLDQSSLGVLNWATISPNPFLLLLSCWIPTYYDVYSLVLDWTLANRGTMHMYLCNGFCSGKRVEQSQSLALSVWFELI